MSHTINQTRIMLQTSAEKLLVMDGYDDCIVGICYRCGQEPILAYDMNKVIKKLMDRRGWPRDVAQDWFNRNQLGAAKGSLTPCFIVPATRK